MSGESSRDDGARCASGEIWVSEEKDRSGVVAQLHTVTVLTGEDEDAIERTWETIMNVCDMLEFVEWRVDGAVVRPAKDGDPDDSDDLRDARNSFMCDVMSDLDEKVEYVYMEHPLAARHPRFQAALADAVCRLAASGEPVAIRNSEPRKLGDRFVIATQSDTIIDHVQLAVRDGVLSPDETAIIDFRIGEEPEIVTIATDGSVEQASSRYRRWQLAEQRRFFGIAGAEEGIARDERPGRGRREP